MTERPTGNAFRRLWGFFTDTSDADKNQQEVDEVLREALGYDNGDGDFEANLRTVLNRRYGSAGGYDHYLSLLEMMGKFRRSYTDGSNLRSIAEQILEDLPLLYGKRIHGNHCDL